MKKHLATAFYYSTLKAMVWIVTIGAAFIFANCTKTEDAAVPTIVLLSLLILFYIAYNYIYNIWPYKKIIEFLEISPSEDVRVSQATKVMLERLVEKNRQAAKNWLKKIRPLNELGVFSAQYEKHYTELQIGNHMNQMSVYQIESRHAADVCISHLINTAKQLKRQIILSAMPQEKKEEALQIIKEQQEEDEQIYAVCTLINIVHRNQLRDTALF